MIVNENTNPRTLSVNGKTVNGGSNRASVYTQNGLLYFDGTIIPSEKLNDFGLTFQNNKYYFDGFEVGENAVNPPVNPPVDNSGYWNPPTQSSSTRLLYDYNQYIAEYDALMASNPTYITKRRYEVDGVPQLTEDGNYELFSYVLEPPTYSKTIFIQAGIHGNEMDCKQILLRLIKLICNNTTQPGYTQLAPLRNDTRLVIIPIVSPWGHENSSMNVLYTNSQFGMNMNRNYDANQQFGISGTGVGGVVPFERVEVRHTRDVINEIGAENIDYAQDWHDGGQVPQHIWINFASGGKNRTIISDLINYLVQKWQIASPVLDYCKEDAETGTTQNWFSKTMGLTSSTVEWMGGFLGYNFDSDHMTKSMELRANCVLEAYKKDVKAWEINEDPNASYFHFDYPRAFSRSNLRLDGAQPENKVTDAMIYARWNKLTTENPAYIKKSAQLGFDAYGTNPIYTYTLGNGSKKVLYVGGVMRFGGTNKIDEYAIYLIAEYLCNPYIVNQSKFLQDLKNNYTIIVLPCIDNVAGNATTIRNAGLNNTMFTEKKWQIVNNKAVPTAFALNNHDIPILKGIIDTNQDLKCIVSGGEIMELYSANPQDYSLNFETQIVVPKNYVHSLENYKSHLEVNRNELVSIENTKGVTFGDYAFDNYEIPTYFVRLKVSKKFTELAQYHMLTSAQFMHSHYEVGRRIANIINLFLK